MDCKTCKETREQAQPVSFAAFDSMKATMERTIRRLWILTIVLILLLFGTNAAWIWYESQWEVVETTEITQEADGDSFNSIIGGDFYGSKADGPQDKEPNP